MKIRLGYAMAYRIFVLTNVSRREHADGVMCPLCLIEVARLQTDDYSRAY